jgi:F0F1-type ATP synthase membrane subunit b/b'
MPNLDWKTIREFIEALGWTKGVFAIFFFLMQFLYWGAMRGRLKDRQTEIDRIAAENKQYRERFLAFIDKKLEYKPKKGGH